MSTFQDGTQAFAVPDSPITINSVVYIAEDIQIKKGSTVVRIKNADGTGLGKVIIPEPITGTCKLQLATSSTAIPPIGQTFVITNTAWAGTYYVEDVGLAYTQGNYTYVNISFEIKLN